MDKPNQICLMCKEIVSPLYDFSCEHQICPRCLLRHMFVNNMKDFEKQDKKIINCIKCDGKMKLNLEQILDIFQYKAILDQQKIKLKCEKHNSEKDFFCIDCKIYICKKCLDEKENEHKFHNIIKNKTLADKLRYYNSKLNVKYPKYETFLKHINQFGEKFKSLIEGAYDTTIKELDNVINDLIDYRVKYVTIYKDTLKFGIQTVKIIKFFYLNYYLDLEKGKKIDDIFLLKYLNEIKYELDDVILNHDTDSLIKIEEIKKNVNLLKEKLNNILKINFKFTEINDKYKIINEIPNCNSGTIVSLIKLKNNKIITGGRSFSSSIFNIIENEYKKESEIPTDKISCLLELKNGIILSASSSNKSNYTIYIWKEKDKIKQNEINIPKSLNSSFISKNSRLSKSSMIFNSLSRQNSLNYNYVKIGSLSAHDNSITMMLELNDNKLVTASLDKTIKIWEFKKDNFENKQILKSHIEGVYALILLYDGRLVSGGNDNKIIVWKNDLNKFSVMQKFRHNDNHDRIISLFQLKDGKICSGGKTGNFYIWKEKIEEGYFLNVFIFKSNNYDITVINQLKDGRIVLAYKIGIIKILKSNDGEKYFEDEEIKGNYNKNDEHIYGLLILNDEIICASVNNNLIFWKNRKKW